jgi:chemotaxis protein methyltransferase CheR
MNNMSHEKEFLYTDKDFLFLSQLVTSHAGISLPDGKKQLLYSRLTRRLRELGLSSFAEYCDLLNTNLDDEFPKFINAITTNVTHFYRENHHFEFLKETILPEIAKKNKIKITPKLRIWSAGCSTGEEAYSIAIIVREIIPDLYRWDAKILATDLDSDVLEKARNGFYTIDKIKDVNKPRMEKWFRLIKNDKEKSVYKINSDLREMIAFRQLNLMDKWPMSGQFDVIFCRNVTIYFDKKTRTDLIDRFADILTPEGYLILGHSESLYGITARFTFLGKNMHKKIM